MNFKPFEKKVWLSSPLGQMYVCDERFKANIDKSGEGTAECMARAIEAYLAKK